MCTLWQNLFDGIINLWYVTLIVTFDLLWKTSPLPITFLSCEIELSYFASVFLMTRPFQWYHKFERVNLTVTFDLLFKNFNIGHLFVILRDSIFIFGMCVPYDKVFQVVPNVELWPTFEKLFHWPSPACPKRWGFHIWHMCSLWQEQDKSSDIEQQQHFGDRKYSKTLPQGGRYKTINF